MRQVSDKQVPNVCQIGASMIIQDKLLVFFYLDYSLMIY